MRLNRPAIKPKMRAFEAPMMARPDETMMVTIVIWTIRPEKYRVRRREEDSITCSIFST